MLSLPERSLRRRQLSPPLDREPKAAREFAWWADCQAIGASVVAAQAAFEGVVDSASGLAVPAALDAPLKACHLAWFR